MILHQSNIWNLILSFLVRFCYDTWCKEFKKFRKTKGVKESTYIWNDFLHDVVPHTSPSRLLGCIPYTAYNHVVWPRLPFCYLLIISIFQLAKWSPNIILSLNSSSKSLKPRTRNPHKFPLRQVVVLDCYMVILGKKHLLRRFTSGHPYPPPCWKYQSGAGSHSRGNFTLSNIFNIKHIDWTFLHKFFCLLIFNFLQ